MNKSKQLLNLLETKAAPHEVASQILSDFKKHPEGKHSYDRDEPREHNGLVHTGIRD